MVTSVGCPYKSFFKRISLTDWKNNTSASIFHKKTSYKKKIKKARKVQKLSSLQYPEPGSNRHGSLHWCLRPTRLPIPPSGRLLGKTEPSSEPFRIRSANIVTFISYLQIFQEFFDDLDAFFLSKPNSAGTRILLKHKSSII